VREADEIAVRLEAGVEEKRERGEEVRFDEGLTP